MKRKRRRSTTTNPSEPSQAPSPVWLFIDRNFDLLFVSAAVGVAILALGLMVDNHLFKDDYRWLYSARHEMTASSVWTTRVIGFFRPFINATYWVTERLTPGNLAVYNITQIVLHLTNTLLVYRLLLVLWRDRTLAAVAGFSFLVTYNHLGAVIWVSGRTTLIMAFFLLLSFLVALEAHSRLRQWMAWGLFGLALFSKEEAIVGSVLLALLLWVRRPQAVERVAPGDSEAEPTSRPEGPWTRDNLKLIAGYVAVSILYFALRTGVIGHVTQANWSPGAHVFGNVAGSFLGQFWPTLLMKLTGQPLMARPGDSAWWPEILVLPLVAALLLAAWRLGRLRLMSFALLWMVVSVLPMALLNFRFVSMGSVMHTRYHYLPCIGSLLALSILLVGIWRWQRHRWTARLVAAALFIAVSFVEVQRTRDFELRFSRGNAGLAGLVQEMFTVLDENPDIDRLVLGESPYPRGEIIRAVHLERPALPVFESDGTHADVTRHQPCIYFSHSTAEGGYALFVLR